MSSKEVTYRSGPRGGLNLSEVLAFRELFTTLAKRDLLGTYHSSVLGIAWRFLPPIFALCGYTIIFGLFGKISMPTSHPYAVALLCGLFPWLIFSSTVLAVSNSIIANSALIKKVYFPRLIAPLVSLADKLIDIFVGLVILIGLFYFTGIPIAPNLLPTLAYALWALLLGLAVGLWLSWICVLLRDLAHALPMLLQVLFYLSPVVYPTQSVPYPFRSYYELNPLVALIDGMRWSILGAGNWPIVPSLVAGVLTIVLLVGGLFFFRRAERILIDVL